MLFEIKSVKSLKLRSGKELEVKVKILNRLGLHARPAALIARVASRFAADISLTPEGGSAVDAKSILSLLMLGAPCGSELTLAVNSSDAAVEAEAVQEISALFAAKFDEE